MKYFSWMQLEATSLGFLRLYQWIGRSTHRAICFLDEAIFTPSPTDLRIEESRTLARRYMGYL